MKITIYQVNLDRDKNRIAFMGYESLPKFQGSEQIDSGIYDKVYAGEVDCNNLEEVYQMFNINHPDGYKARSLSVSDIVEVMKPDGEKSDFYFCDSVGFRKVDFEPEKTKQSERFYEKGVRKVNAEEIRKQYPEGTLIELMEMKGERQMPYGLKGTVKFVDDAGQIHMKWENGSSLALNVNEDTFSVVEPPQKITVLLVEPNKYPKLVEIEDSLEAMQRTVGGDIEEYMPFEDEVAIICNEEGKVNGEPLNRAVYGEAPEEDMTYGEMVSRFREAEKTGGVPLTGYIVFSADSFDKVYSEAERTYAVSSSNKAFMPRMGGYSIYGSSLDGSDKNIRLEQYMADEMGGKDGWKIERCYMKDDSRREMLDIIAGKFFICYAPIESEKFLSLPDNLAQKYKEMFKYPERFYQTAKGIEAKPFKPKSLEMER